MKYKEDWDKAQKRLEAFWQGEPADRALAGILAPRKTSKLPKFPHLTHGPWLGGLENFSDSDKESIAWHLSLAESVFGSAGVFSRTSGLVYSRSHIYDFKCLLSTENYKRMIDSPERTVAIWLTHCITDVPLFNYISHGIILY